MTTEKTTNADEGRLDQRVMALADELRSVASEGYDEWRVQDPNDGSYCIAYSWPDSHNPEREAREWLANQKTKYPKGLYADYVVACVRVVPKKDRLLAEAANKLDRMRAALIACERVIGLLTPSGICNDAHHAKADRHDSEEQCPVVGRFIEAQRLARDELRHNAGINAPAERAGD